MHCQLRLLKWLYFTHHNRSKLFVVVEVSTGQSWLETQGSPGCNTTVQSWSQVTERLDCLLTLLQQLGPCASGLVEVINHPGHYGMYRGESTHSRSGPGLPVQWTHTYAKQAPTTLSLSHINNHLNPNSLPHSQIPSFDIHVFDIHQTGEHMYTSHFKCSLLSSPT